MVRVLIVDDHQLVRAGFRRILEDTGRFLIVGEADTGELALSCIEKSLPDVILMDLLMPGMGGFEATRKILRSFPNIGVIVLTGQGAEPFPSRLLDAGARGYLTKDCTEEDIVRAITIVSQGKRFLESGVAQRMALTKTGREESLLDGLTQREAQIFDLLTRGHTTQGICEMLCLSPKTVSTYRCRLYEKFDVANDVMLTHLALAYGFLAPASAT